MAMSEERNQMSGGMEEEDDTLEGKYLTFPLGNEEYGLEIRHVTEIVGIQRITEVPDMPPFIRGVINLRGESYSGDGCARPVRSGTEVLR